MRRAAAVDDAALAIKAHPQLTEHLSVFPGLRQADRIAIGIGESLGIGAGWGTDAIVDQRRRPEQAVRITTDQDVDAAQFTDETSLVGMADVRQQDDLVDALREQRIDLPLRSLALILELGARVGAGRFARFDSDGQTDDADALAVADHDLRALHGARRTRWMQRRLRAEMHIGAEQRRAAVVGMQQVDEVAQPGIAEVEFVIADSHGVEADLIHQRRVGLAGSAAAIEEQRADQRIAVARRAKPAALTSTSTRCPAALRSCRLRRRSSRCE